VNDETEQLENEIIQRFIAPGYGHAENILHVLEQYQTQMSHADAIRKLHAEVCKD
jgi:hypothetical protein